MSVRETLELDISDALASIEQVGDRLTNVAQAFGEVLSDALSAALEGLPIITPEVDTASVSDEVEQALTEATAAEQTVEVAADTDSITGDVDAAIAEVDTTVEVVVEADTSQASQAVDQLGESLTDAGGAGTEAAGGLGATAAAAGLAGRAAGSASGLLGRASSALSAIGPAGVAAGAAAASVGFLYNAAFDAVAVTQAWEQSLGPLGDRILDLDAGTTGFSGSLNQLAQDLGSSDEAVLIATQRYAEFLRSAGQTDEQIVRNAQNINVLAAQIRANNPQLGTMDEIINTLSRSLQRGGPRLQAYGIAIDQNSIKLRAAEMTGRDVEDSFTRAELSAAGLSLAMEQLNPNVASVSDGMDNVSIKADSAREKIGDTLEAIGEPLVQPITDTFESLAQAFVNVGEAAAPLVENVLGPLLQVIAGLAQQVATATGEGENLEDTFLGIVGLFQGAQPDPMWWLEGASDNARALYGILPPTTEATEDLAEAERIAAEQAELLIEKFAGVYQTFVQFSDTMQQSIPTVRDALGQITEDTTADQLTKNLQDQIAATDRWAADIGMAYALGLDNISQLLVEIGPTQSAILLEQYRGREQELEDHLQLMADAQQRAAAAANEIALRGYLRMRDITGAQANAIVLTLGAELQLGVPTQAAIEEVINAPATQELRVLAAYGKLGADATGALGSQVNSAQGATIAGNLINGMTKEMYLRMQAARDAAAAVGDAALSAIKAALGIRSPSQEMALVGDEMIRGLVLGLNRSEGLATSAVTGLGGSLAGVSLAAGAPTIRDVTVQVPVTVSAGMTADDGRAIGQAAGQAAAAEVARMMRLEAMVA